MNNHCCNHACYQGRTCPLTYKYPRTMREAFPYPAAIELEHEVDPEWDFVNELLLWVEGMLVILGAVTFVAACCFAWGYYS